jgi:hypothetical protein
MTLVMFARCSDANFQAGTGAPSQGKQKLNPKLPPITPGEKTLNLRYGNGIKPTLADYLFVLDNSVSMNAAAARVASGLAAISKDTFPESAQVAVMTTMVAKDAMAPNLTTHADINRKDHACIDLEPGFLSLYNGSAQEKFKACRNNNYPNAYPIKGCDQSWFKPFDVNSDGLSCFSAALQSQFHAVGYYRPFFELGGDYYDVIPINDQKVAFCIADISGKGINAAIIMANFQAILRSLLLREFPIEQLVDLLNFKIFKNSLILTYFHQKQLIITQNVNHFVSINMLAGSLIDKTKIKRIQAEQIHS